MADTLNEHFVNVGPKLSESMPPGRHMEVRANVDETSFTFTQIRVGEVAKLIRGLSASKSCGVDGLTARLIKSCGAAIYKPLTHIFNVSLSKGIFPTIWKVARVTPLYKDGAHDDCSNYRPISVLPILSKVFERLVHERVYSYISANGLLNECQAGFRKRNSTGTCLIDFLNKIYTNMDDGKLTGVLFLHLRKAFDTVDHSVAISKLSDYNLSLDVLYWFKSYLSGRTQVTKVNGEESGPRNVVCGVPQGSILGPLIFIMYINSLPTVLTRVTPYLYADDTALVVTGNSEQEIVEALSEDLNECSKWL